MKIEEKKQHIPVLLKETIELLDPKPNEKFIDCTVGLGGHSKEILEKTGPDGKLLAIDLNRSTLELAHKSLENFEGRVLFIEDNFVNLEKIVAENNFAKVDGILLDLGMSSWEIEKSGKGFSFRQDEPLDMRFGKNGGLTAADIVNRWVADDLIKIFREYGEERFAKPIARQIIEHRKKSKIETTNDLVEIIAQVKRRRGRIHPATQVFQALRIAVNDELENLKKTLEQAVRILNKDGRIAVISFHSLEDRIVKWFFRGNSNLKILTKKPIVAQREEVLANPRSRSAKLRAVKKMENEN